MSFDSCLTLLHLRDKLPVDVIRETAREYEAEGVKPGEALLRAVTEHLDEAKRQEAHLIATVKDKFVAGGGKLPEPAAAPVEAKQESPEADAVTQAFSAWFGKSKVVDENGQPLVMYHGTSSHGFNTFDTYASNYGLMGMGGYFTADRSVAESYTTKGKGGKPGVYSVYLSIKNPIDMDAKADPEQWQKQFDGIEDYHEGGDTNESWYRAAEDLMTDQELPKWEGAEAMQEGLRAMGFDGITHIGGGRVKSDGVRHRVYIAFDPEQVKSATSNVGTFDPASPDIRYSTKGDAPATSRAELEAEAKALTAQIRARAKADRDAGLDQISDETLALNRKDSERVSAIMREIEDLNRPKVEVKIEDATAPWYDDATEAQQGTLDKFAGWDGAYGFKLRALGESLHTAASASMTDYEVVPGVRKVYLSELGDLGGYTDAKEKKRIAVLSDSLKRSGEIEPIFVGIDADGEAWVIEGQHRARAFKSMGFQSIPARVVVDMSDTSSRYSTSHPMAKESAREISPLVQSLADKGAIVLHGDASTLPVKGKIPAGVQALTTADGTIHVVANALGDNATGIILHEAFHAGAESLVGSKAWSGLLDRLGRLYSMGEKSSGTARAFFDAARERVATAKAKGAVSKGMEAEEFGAYAIEEYAKAPASIRKWVDDLLGAVKAWALRRFGAQLGEVTPAQLSSLAKLALLDAQVARSADHRMEPAFSSEGGKDSERLDAENEAIRQRVALGEEGKESTIRAMTDDELRREFVRLRHARANGPSVPKHAAILSDMQKRARGFKVWAKANDVDADQKGFADYLKEEHGIEVADDGLVEVDRLTDAAAKIIGNNPVAMFHHTATGVLDSIKKGGLRVGKQTNFFNTQAGVYVSFMRSGKPVDVYSKRAALVHGGDPVVLRIQRNLDQIKPDPDDADLAWAQGRQYITPNVPASDIKFEEGGKFSADSSKTIEVDGQRRPIENANGKLIAPDMHQQMNFWRWAGDTKVVDAQGRPQVVYHGTGADFSEFDPDSHFGTAAAANERANAFMRGKVLPVYLSIKNPKRMVDQYNVKSGGWEDAIEEAKAEGHDGIVYRNDVEDDGSDSYIAFSPEQIKSATGNDGSFSGDTPDIRFSVSGAAPAATWAAPAPTMRDTIIHTLQDKHIDMKRVVTAIREQTGQLADKWDPYLQEELFHGRSATGFKAFLHDELRPLLDDMKLRGVSMAELEEYLHMRHAEEANAQIAAIDPQMPDGGSGVDTADARAYLSALPAAKAQAYQALAAKVDAITGETQRLLVDYGLEKQSTIDAWNATYQHYVPLMREDMANPLGGTGTGSGFSTRGPSSKRRTGSKRAVVDILANVAMARERAIVRGEKNRLDLALYGLSLQAPNPEFWKPINPQKNPTALAAELVNMGLSPAAAQAIVDEPKQKVIDPHTGLVVRRVNPLLRSAPNVVAVRVGGEDRFIFFSERNERAMRMAMTLKNLNAAQLGLFYSIVGKGTRWFSSVNTQYNPIFGVVNLMRDTGSVALNLTTTPLNGKQAQVMGEASRLFWAVGRKGFRLDSLAGPDAATWEEFQKEGGITGYRAMFGDSGERTKDLEKELRRMSSGRLANGGRAIFDWLSDYNEALENVTRLAVYKVAKEQGLTIQQAASIAKNASVNFNRSGTIAKQVGALYAFFNAAVQGTTRMAQTLDPRTKSGKAIITGGVLLGVMQALMLAAGGFDDGEPPEFIKSKSLVIPIPGTDAKDYLTIPLPQGFNILPTIGRLVTEFMLGGAKHPGRYIANMAGSVADSFNPIGNAGWSIQTILPTVIDPLAALESNQDWTGKKIYTEDMSPLKPTPGHTRARAAASAPAKYAAEAINWMTGGNKYIPGMWSPTPEHLEYLIGQLSGGAGRELLKTWQAGQSVVTGEELPTHRIPGAGRFYGRLDDGASIHDRFTQNLIELNLLEQEHEGRAKAKDGAKEFREHHPLVKLADQAQAIQRDVADMRKEKQRLMEKGASRDRIRLMDERMRSRMGKFNQRFEQEQKKQEEAVQ